MPSEKIAPIGSTPGWKLVATIPDGAEVIGMVHHQGMVIVATTNGVYLLDADYKLTPIEFAAADRTSEGKL